MTGRGKRETGRRPEAVGAGPRACPAQRHGVVPTAAYSLIALCLCILALRVTYTESPTAQMLTSMPGSLTDTIYSLTLSGLLIFAFILWLAVGLYRRRLRYRVTGIEFGLVVFTLAAVIATIGASDKRAAITQTTVLLGPVFAALLLAQILGPDSHLRVALAIVAALGIVSAFQCAEQFLVSNAAMIEQYEKTPEMMLSPLGIEPGTFQHFMFEHRLYSEGIHGFFTTSNSAASFAILASFAAAGLLIQRVAHLCKTNGVALRSALLPALAPILAVARLLATPSAATAALFVQRLAKFRSDVSSLRCVFLPALATLLIVAGLFLTQSKGGILAFIVGLTIFGSLAVSGRHLAAHRRLAAAVLIPTILLVVGAVGYAAVSYGLEHDSLPGGNSMLVRWQYWAASARMYADRPWTGVGPGNFSDYYPHYKPAQAIESVSDPHNFVLSLLTQYGPLGLLGFLAMVLVPLWRSIASVAERTCERSDSSDPFAPPGGTGKLVCPWTREHESPNEEAPSNKSGGATRPASHATYRDRPADDKCSPSPFRKPALLMLSAVSASLLLVRPILIPTMSEGSLDVLLYGVMTLYVAPTAAFLIGFLLITSPMEESLPTPSRFGRTTLTFALASAITAVLLHNLIDFALFEPGVWMTFWIAMACLTAAQEKRRHSTFSPSGCSVESFSGRQVECPLFRRVGVVTVVVVLLGAYLSCVWAPVWSATMNIRRAQHAASMGQFDAAHELLDAAFAADPLSAAAVTLNGRLYVQRHEQAGQKRPELLEQATQRFRKAVEVNPADYKSYERLALLYAELGRWQDAYDWYLKAVERYPGCERLWFKLAQVAERLGKTDTAVEHYSTAVEIEQSYQQQFRRMYPEWEKVVSRLGDEDLQIARRRIEVLSRQ